MLPESAITQYRALSGLAVAGLILGLFSPLAIIDPLLWVVPFSGAMVSGLALGRIAIRAPGLTGRKAAVAGLVLSVFTSAAAPADWLAYRWAVRREARQFAQEWFDFLAADQPQKAYQLVLHPRSRQPFDGHLWAFYRESPRRQADLDNYVSQPPMRTLLALGHKAQVQYCETIDQTRENDTDRVTQVYAVTGDDSGEKKTFFVELHLERIALEPGKANWRLGRAEAGRISDL